MAVNASKPTPPPKPVPKVVPKAASEAATPRRPALEKDEPQQPTDPVDLQPLLQQHDATAPQPVSDGWRVADTLADGVGMSAHGGFVLGVALVALLGAIMIALRSRKRRSAWRLSGLQTACADGECCPKQAV